MIPVVVGGQWWPTLTAWRFLFDRGIAVNAVLPPAVPVGSARLRVTVTSEHTEDDLDQITSAFEELAQTLGRVAAVPAAQES